MPRVLLVLAIVAVTVYALVEAAQTPANRTRLMPRWLWFVAIVALPVVGPVGWFAVGRPRRVEALFALLGGRVSHSLSPAIQNAAFEAFGLPWLYVPVALESLHGFHQPGEQIVLPLGLFRSEAIFDNSLFGEIPTEQLSPVAA